MRPAWLSLGIAGLSFAASVGLACSKSSDTTPTTTGKTPEDIFRSFQPDLVNACGGTNGACHVDGTYRSVDGVAAPKWLGPGDPYAAAKAYPGIVPIDNDAHDSKLLTQVVHDGPALTSMPDLADKVSTWISAELAAGGVVRPVTDAFYVTEGHNVVSLSTLAADASGAQLLFEAQTVGANLFLNDIQITAPATKRLHLQNVTFVILPAAAPVQIDTSSGFQGSLEVGAGATVSFFSGQSVFPGWKAQNRLKIVFDVFQTADPVADAGPGVMCKSVDTFVSSAIPQFTTDLGNGQTCATCHAAKTFMPGSQFDVAIAAWDLRGYDTAPATACVHTLSIVNLANKPQSDVIITPTGGAAGDPTHPVRAVCGMPGDAAADAASPNCVPTGYAAAILDWLNNE